MSAASVSIAFAHRTFCVVGCLLLTVWTLVTLGGCAKPDAEEVGDAKEAPPRRTTSEGQTWYDDLEEALSAASQGDRVVVVDFSGIDWCEPCETLHREVFASEEFGKWAEDRAILVAINVPDPSKPRDAHVAELTDRYDVTMYPTVHFLNSQQQSLGSIEGGFDRPREWLALADSIVANSSSLRDNNDELQEGVSASENDK